MWSLVLDGMLRQFVVTGALDVTYPDGTTRRYGRAQGADAHLTLTDPALPRRLVLSTELALGEGYMDGTATIAGDDLDAFFTLIIRNIARFDAWWWRLGMRLRRAKRWTLQNNPSHRARANVAHHYDLSGDLYDLFLDADRQYSCAYFAHPDMTLDQAQKAKKHHIAAKLCLEPDMEVFEIGCGWGGMALTLAQDYGVRVLGVTLSSEQHKIATERAARAGLSDRVRFELKDYRAVRGAFDRIVSIGMFEHVGVPHYGEYFDVVRERLKPDGIALIHTIGRGPPGQPARGSPNTSSRAAIARRCRKWPPPSRPQTSTPPIWKSGACTTPKPCATGTTGSWPIKIAPARSTMTASAGCGATTSRPANTPSATTGRRCSRCRSPTAPTRCH